MAKRKTRNFLSFFSVNFPKEHVLKECLYCLLLAIVSLFLVSDLFFNHGRELTFDGMIHITTIGQFVRALSDKEIPVSWADGFANYGLPLPLISHQTTSYVGALFFFVTKNIVFSYNLLYVFGAITSTFFLYIFLRLSVQAEAALVGSFVFNFAPYRIVNVYARGALPEFFSSFLVPLILMGIVFSFQKKRWWGAPLFILSSALLMLTHPMIFLIDAVVLFPFLIFILFQERLTVRTYIFSLLRFTFFCGLAALIASYYVLPLITEIKYFYQGQTHNHLVLDSYLTWQNFSAIEFWPYFYQNQIGERAQFIQIGLIETIFLIIGLVYSITYFFRNKKINELHFWLIVAGISLFFTLHISQIFYFHLPFIKEIQFQWRFFSAFIFAPPIILALLIDRIRMKYQSFFAFTFILLTCMLRFPQLYGKNFIIYPNAAYFFTKVNLQSNNLNPLWVGQTEDYPVESRKYAIIDGQGKVNPILIKNAQRTYSIQAQSPLRMVDYTFYFPGWNVYVDGQKTSVEYQDVNYRGVITYQVPSGDHKIDIKFEDTKIRLLGKILSVVGMLCLGFLFLFQFQEHLNFINVFALIPHNFRTPPRFHKP